MYRRERSGLFITLTTALIVVVMAVFTWVMWGMARQINTITTTMLEVNQSFKEMMVDMHSIANNMSVMNQTMLTMNGTMGGMDQTIASMGGEIANMNVSMTQMDGAMQSMTGNISRLTYDVGRASYAFSNPVSYMFGGGFPF